MGESLATRPNDSHSSRERALSQVYDAARSAKGKGQATGKERRHLSNLDNNKRTMEHKFPRMRGPYAHGFDADSYSGEQLDSALHRCQFATQTTGR
jgi:hypothetical protein